MIVDESQKTTTEVAKEETAWDLVTLESTGSNFDSESESQLFEADGQDTTIEGLEKALAETEKELAELTAEQKASTVSSRECLKRGSAKDPTKEKTRSQECPRGEPQRSADKKTGTLKALVQQKNNNLPIGSSRPIRRVRD